MEKMSVDERIQAAKKRIREYAVLAEKADVVLEGEDPERMSSSIADAMEGFIQRNGIEKAKSLFNSCLKESEKLSRKELFEKLDAAGVPYVVVEAHGRELKQASVSFSRKVFGQAVKNVLAGWADIS